MTDALGETKIAAKAAKDSAAAALRTFASTHRPRLQVRFVDMPQGIRHMQMFGTLLIVNTGETTAKIRRAYSEIIIGSDLPMNPKYLEKTGEEIDVQIASGNFGKLAFPTISPREVETKEFLEIGNQVQVAQMGKVPQWKNGNIFVIGWVEYTDEASRVRRRGFCHRYNYLTGRFERHSDQDYEYDD